MKLNVPYFSQHTDVSDPAWQQRACGIASLAMVLHYYKPEESVSVDDLIREALSIENVAPVTARGWTHDVLVWVAHNHGIAGYREEFKSYDPANLKTPNPIHSDPFTRDGIEKIVDSLSGGQPVIISTVRGFKEEDSFHMVVLVGYEESGAGISGFYYNDPDAPAEKDGAAKFVDIETFTREWRKLAVFLRKNMLE